MNLTLLGAPGAGKGTQANVLAIHYKIPHISTGDIFRRHLREETPLGQKAQEYMVQGKLVPDDITEAMVDDRLALSDAALGFVLDGFPRNLNQGKALDGMLAARGLFLDGVIHIAAPYDLLVERLVGRRICPACGATYHIRFDPPQAAGICNVCGTNLVQRPDDRLETVETRLSVYREETAPLIAFYQVRGILLEIDGTRSVEDVSQSIIQQLGARHG
jgi:adenylate kinase